MKADSPGRSLRMQLLAAHTKPRGPRGPRVPKGPRARPVDVRDTRARRLLMVQSTIDETARLAWRFGLTHLSAGDCRKLARLLFHVRKEST